ncbi:MAG: AzlC family ABC transporter permease [Limnochordales bacterium]|nr:AzlC family ABC transporter permease [Limnochordales bacterium]
MRETVAAAHRQAVPHRFWHGVRLAWPVVMGYVPIGLALGVLAGQTGLSPLETGAMSALVYAGASQFVAVAMIGAGAPALSIVVTTFLVNLRHMLMSAALSPFLRGLRPGALAGIAYLITDETFAVGHGEFAARGQGDGVIFAGLGLTSYLSWLSATVAGAWLGGALATPEAWGLDFALPAMFIGLLAGQLRDRLALSVALVAGLAVLAGGPYLGSWSVMAAAVGAAAAGVGVQRWTGQRTGTSS